MSGWLVGSQVVQRGAKRVCVHSDDIIYIPSMYLHPYFVLLRLLWHPKSR